MPTPAVNGEASISHLTDGTRQPYSIELEVMVRISLTVPSLFLGVNPMSFIAANAKPNMTTSTAARITNGTPRLVSWATNPPSHRAGEHADAGDDLTTSEDRFEAAVEAGRVERVDQPGFDRPGEEGEAESEQHRDDRPGPERSLDLPEQHVEQCGLHQGDRAGQVGDPPADGVGDDPGRDLEEHHAGGEKGVRGEGLEVATARHRAGRSC